jgi:hypothetical protein
VTILQDLHGRNIDVIAWCYLAIALEPIARLRVLPVELFECLG